MHRAVANFNTQQTIAQFILHQSGDVTALMEDKLGDRLLGIIHRDESVVEANASQKSILDFSSSSAAAFDIEIMAKKISALLGIKIGDGTVHSQPRMSGL